VILFLLLEVYLVIQSFLIANLNLFYSEYSVWGLEQVLLLCIPGKKKIFFDKVREIFKEVPEALPKAPRSVRTI